MGSRVCTRWSAVEDKILRQTYPDYLAMLEQIPTRTYAGIRGRVRLLGIATRRHTWTGKELKDIEKLRRQGKTWPEIARIFPSRSLSRAQMLLRHRPGRARRFFGLPLLDAVRSRAFDAGMTLRQLDRLASTEGHFAHSDPHENLACIARAVEALGGELAIEWPEEP